MHFFCVCTYYYLHDKESTCISPRVVLCLVIYKGENHSIFVHSYLNRDAWRLEWCVISIVVE
jgi:hypothetical protein